MLSHKYLWYSVSVTSLSSFLFGFAMSSLNTALQSGESGDPTECYGGYDPTCPKGSILRDIKLPAASQEIAQGSLIFGAWIGSLLAGWYADRWGCRNTLLRLNFLFTSGATLSSLPNLPMLYVGRLILGFAVGCEATVVPVLLSEISPTSIRGKVVCCHQLAITLGIAAAGGLGAALIDVPHGWRWLQASIALPALFQGLASYLVPESPRWLSHKNGKQSLQRNRQSQTIASYIIPEDDEFDMDFDRLTLNKQDSKIKEGTWKEVFSRPAMVATGIAVMAFSALTGINTVILYSTTIFSLAGLDRSSIATAIVAAVNVIATLLAQRLADTTGRRKLLLCGIFMMLTSLVLLAVVLLTFSHYALLQGIIAVLSVLAFVSGYAIGFGAVGWTILSELVPSHLRSKSCGLFVSANWACNFLVSTLTLTAIERLGGEAKGVAFLYLIFAGLCASAYVFVYACIHETMGISLEELHDETMEMREDAEYPKARPRDGGVGGSYYPLIEEQEMLPESPR